MDPSPGGGNKQVKTLICCMFIVATVIKNRNCILVHSLINTLSSLSPFEFYKLNCQYYVAGTFLKVHQKV